MSRNITEYSKAYFTKIIGDIDVPSKDKMRIRPEDDNDVFESSKKDFSHLKLTSEIDILFDSSRVVSFTIEDRKFILLTNMERYLLSLDELALIDINIIKSNISTGMFLALVKDIDLQVKSELSKLDLENYYLFQQDDTSYDGHSQEDVMACIEDIVVFEILADSILFEKNHLGIAYYIASHMKNCIHLSIQSLIYQYREVLKTNYCQLPYENIFLSLTANHWKHAFLEVYRCVERLFVLPRILDLKSKLQLTDSGMSIARSCFLELGWKSKEEEALKKLLEMQCTQTIVTTSQLATASLLSGISLNYQNFVLTKKSAEKLAEKIYKIRNSFVHQFHPDDEQIVSAHDLEKLIGFLLVFTNEIYHTYQAELA